MGRRRRGREYALQMLFQMDLSGDAPEAVFGEFWSGQPDAADEVRGFAEELAVDRNVLRLAAFELLHRPDTPAAVVIDEAIEVVRKYGSEQSARFVNGILDGLKRRVERGELRSGDGG